MARRQEFSESGSTRWPAGDFVRNNTIQDLDVALSYAQIDSAQKLTAVSCAQIDINSILASLRDADRDTLAR